jgi:proline dehydrogenase
MRAYFGTHDPAMVEHVKGAAVGAGLSKGAFEFQMLYGIQRPLQSLLAREGYRVRVLISYGSSWFPWFMRRLAERPANALFVLKNVLIG